MIVPPFKFMIVSKVEDPAHVIEMRHRNAPTLKNCLGVGNGSEVSAYSLGVLRVTALRRAIVLVVVVATLVVVVVAGHLVCMCVLVLYV